MTLRCVIISFLVALALHVVIPPSVGEACRDYITERVLLVISSLLQSRYVPDGLISLGAIILARDYFHQHWQNLIRVFRKDGKD